MADAIPHLRELIAQNRERGWTTADEVARRLGGQALSPDQVAGMYRRIIDAGMRILETDPGRSMNPVDELAFTEPESEPVKIYLQRLERLRPLSEKQERYLVKIIRLARSAEEFLSGDQPSDLSSIRELAESLKLAVGENLAGKPGLDLCRQVAELGILARRLLLETTQPTVVRVALGYQRRGLPIWSLVGEGNRGLVRALGTYDHRHGFAFGVYATWWIHQAISQAIVEQSRTVRVEANKVDEVNRMLRTQAQLMEEKVREPSVNEMARRLGVSPEAVQELLNIG